MRASLFFSTFIGIALLSLTVSNSTLAKDRAERDSRPDIESKWSKEDRDADNRVIFMSIDGKNLAQAVAQEFGPRLDRRSMAIFREASSGTVEIMVVMDAETADYYIHTEAVDLYVQVHADGSSSTWDWDGMSYGKDLRLGESLDRTSGRARALSLPMDAESGDAVFLEDDGFLDLGADYSDLEPSYLVGSGDSGSVCGDFANLWQDECDRDTIAVQCCNNAADDAYDQCVQNGTWGQTGTIILGGGLVVVGGIMVKSVVLAKPGFAFIAAGTGLIANALSQNIDAECQGVRSAHFGDCWQTAAIMLDMPDDCF